MHYMEHNQTFPDDTDLFQHLEAERLEHKLAMQALTDDGDIALGWKSEFIYRKRFNLTVENTNLLVDFAPAVPDAHAHGSPFVLAWRNYIKSVFQKGFMYRLSLNPAVVLYVAENKTLAGKEDRTYEGEAIGRRLAVVLFEAMGAMGGNLVRRVNRQGLGMQQELMSIAEIIQTIGGIALPADPDRTAAQTEIILEERYQDMEITRFSCSVVPAADDAHVYHMHGEIGAESALTHSVPVAQLTKMILARLLQRNGELEVGETLQSTWNKSLLTLTDSVAHLLPAVPVALAAPAAPGRGRGKGKGPGKGRGKGRGKCRGRGP